ncbi:DNA polymerase zeta [Coemansia sp. RSA 376]|nr:DNA polymerase zeta [Coemansia sp. RSA 376]
MTELGESEDDAALEVQIGNIDYYMAPPTPADCALRAPYSIFKEPLKQVPVLRIFGITRSEQRICLHVHQVWPYLYVAYDGPQSIEAVRMFGYQLGLSLNHALNVSLKNSSGSLFVAAVVPVKGVPFYGFCAGYRPLLKVFVANPDILGRASNLLTSGAVMGRRHEVFESHLAYIMQFLVDYNLYGVDWARLDKVLYRSPLPEDAVNTGHPLFISDSTVSAKHRWVPQGVPSYLVNPTPPDRGCRCELEADAVAADVANRRQVHERHIHHVFQEAKLDAHFGRLIYSLDSIWIDENRRRAQLGLDPLQPRNSQALPDTSQLPSCEPATQARARGLQWSNHWRLHSLLQSALADDRRKHRQQLGNNQNDTMADMLDQYSSLASSGDTTEEFDTDAFGVGAAWLSAWPTCREVDSGVYVDIPHMEGQFLASFVKGRRNSQLTIATNSTDWDCKGDVLDVGWSSLGPDLNCSILQQDDHSIAYAFKPVPPSIDRLVSTLSAYNLAEAVTSVAAFSDDQDIPTQVKVYSGHRIWLSSRSAHSLPIFDPAYEHSRSCSSLGDEYSRSVHNDRRQDMWGKGAIDRLNSSVTMAMDLCQQWHEGWWRYSQPPPKVGVLQICAEAITATPMQRRQRDQSDLKWSSVLGTLSTYPGVTSQSAAAAAVVGAVVSNFSMPPKASMLTSKRLQTYRSAKVPMSLMSLEILTCCREAAHADPNLDEILCMSASFVRHTSQGGKRHVKHRDIVWTCGVSAESMARMGLPSRVERHHFADELSMILALVEWTHENDPDILCGYEVQQGSWGYVIERAEVAYDTHLCSELSRIIQGPPRKHQSQQFGREKDSWGHRKGAAITIVAQVAQQRAAECLPLVLEPQSRYYTDPVLVLDFQSLYPSIMIAYNYCFSTCLGSLEQTDDDATSSDTGTSRRLGFTSVHVPAGMLNALKDNLTVSPNGVLFVKPAVRRGLLGRMLNELLESRVMLKDAMKQWGGSDEALFKKLDAWQLGLKLIANVTYGYAGASFSGRMPCVELADAIVQSGRETLESAIRLIHSRHATWGARVVYGDTDSVFVHLPGKSRQSAFRIGQEIADAVTKMNPAPVKLKFEKVYQPCILLTKKRYTGWMYTTAEQREPLLDVKGMELVRRDGCVATQRILEGTLDNLFRTNDLSLVKSYVTTEITRLLRGELPLQEYIIAKEVRMGSYSGRTLPAHAKVAADDMQNDPRAEPQHGERVPYVVISSGRNARLVDQVIRPHQLLKRPELRINSQYYVDKQVVPALDRVLSLVGVDVRTWVSDIPRRLRGSIYDAAIDAHSDSEGEASHDLAAGGCQAALPQASKRAALRTLDHFYNKRDCFLCGQAISHVPPSPGSSRPIDLNTARACDDCRAHKSDMLANVGAIQREAGQALKVVFDQCAACVGGPRADALLAAQACDCLDCPTMFQRSVLSRRYAAWQRASQVLEEDGKS